MVFRGNGGGGELGRHQQNTNGGTIEKSSPINCQ